jgi:hypothetical protein
MAVGNVVVWAQVDGGEPFPLRPGSEKDRFTPDDTLLWRYVPLKYFFDALERRTLFFTRLTFHHQTDAFEGAFAWRPPGMSLADRVETFSRSHDTSRCWITTGMLERE